MSHICEGTFTEQLYIARIMALWKPGMLHLDLEEKTVIDLFYNSKYCCQGDIVSQKAKEQRAVN